MLFCLMFMICIFHSFRAVLGEKIKVSEVLSIYYDVFVANEICLIINWKKLCKML